jgi:Mg/Co/Ni transporter MgtE
MVRYTPPLLDAMVAMLCAGDSAILSPEIRKLPPIELARIIPGLDRNQQARLVRILGQRTVGSVHESLPGFQAADLVAGLRPSLAARILGPLPSRLKGGLLRPTDRHGSDSILKRESDCDRSAGSGRPQSVENERRSQPDRLECGR